MSAPAELPLAAAGEAGARASAGRRFRVEGMDCGACAQTVRRHVEEVSGVRSAQVSFGGASMSVAGSAGDEAVLAAVARAGYRAYPADRAADSGRSLDGGRHRARTLSALAALALLVGASAASLLGAPRSVAEPLYLASMLVGGWPIARAAVAALAVRGLDMNVLMTLAAAGAVAIGEYAEGAWVLALFALGTALEGFALERTRGAIDSLMELAPSEARVLVDGRERTLPAERVAPGDLVVVRPGERLAVDGRVVEGSSSVDQAPITGESVPVDAGPGDEVYGGSLAVTGSLTIAATRPAAESTLSRIAALVDEARSKRSPSERFIDRFAAVYTPLVVAAALALATVPPLLFGADSGTWVYRALALLIVACPCSLVISVPVAVVSAIGGAARRGVLIRGGRALEDLGRVDTIALDKTGTLTAGSPELVRVIALDPDLGEEDALALMAAVERRSEHPLAAAIVRAAERRGLAIPAATGFEALPGRGARARVGGQELWAGGPRLAAERLGAEPEEIRSLHAAGRTALVLGAGTRPLALFGIADRIRPEAPAAVAGLSRAGVRRVLMLTGDSGPVARSIAAEAGIDEWRAELLPEGKLRAIEELGDGGMVAMVGDGINDAPALAAAPVGVAMGGAGSDASLAVADVALMSDRLDRLPAAIARARRALAVMRVNVIASLAVKAVLVVLAPFGLVTLVVAVAADMGMSLAVTLNSLRLLGREPAGRDGGSQRTSG